MATPDFIKAPIALVNNLLLPHPKATEVDLSTYSVLVTGATPGSIGFECAKTLLQWGARVCISARSKENVEKSICHLTKALGDSNILLQEEQLKGFPLDLCDSDSVKHFSDRVKLEYSSLDVLINNAGIYLDVLGQWSEPKLSDDGQELHWRVNYLGSVQLTCELLSLLTNTAEKKGEARIVNVSSHMHDNCLSQEMFSGLQPYKSVKAYGRSKLALNHFSFYLHEQLFESKKIKRCVYIQALFIPI